MDNKQSKQDGEQPIAEPKRSSRQKTIVWIIIVWVVALLAGFAYLQLNTNDQSSPSVNQIIDKREQQTNNAKISDKETAARISQQEKIARIGKPAPPFSLPGRSGKVTLSQFRGRPVVVEFAASWCSHCRAEAPIIQKTLPLYPQVQMITISAAREPKKVFTSWFDTFLGKPMIGKLAYDTDLLVARQYGITGYPTLFFIDKEGKLVKVTSGQIGEKSLRDNLKQISR